jgi:hypothetical protein
VLGLPLLLLVLADLVLLGVLMAGWVKSGWRGAGGADGPYGWWQECHQGLTRELLLPPFLFQAGFGAALAATTEFDYQLWLCKIREVWWVVGLLLVILAALGCYTQVAGRDLGERASRAMRTLGLYVALAHLAAAPVALVLHRPLSRLDCDPGMVHLTATVGTGLSLFPQVSLYVVFFLALTGLVIGVFGDTFLRRQGDRGTAR